MNVESLSNETLIGTRRLNRFFAVYLGAFFFIGFAISCVYGFTALAKTKELQLTFEFILSSMGLLVIGMAVSFSISLLLGSKMVQALARKLDHENVISTLQPLIISGDFPFIGFHICFLTGIMLTQLDETLCTTPSLKAFEDLISIQCIPLFLGLNAFILGIGAGVALWAYLWTTKREKKTSSPIHVNFFWTKNSSIEFGILAGIVVLLSLFF